MKKFFTFVVAALAALTMQAETTTTTVWTGSEVAGWNKRIAIPCNWNEVSVGDVLTFTAVTSNPNPNDNWASFHLLSGAWNQVVTDISFPYEEGATKTTTFTMTAVALDSAINRGGLGVQGFGFTLTKIELTTGLWTGEQTISEWGNNLTIKEDALAPFRTAYTTAAAADLYIRIRGGENNNVRISGQWGAWGETAFPYNDFNHAPAMDEDGVIKVELTADFVSNAFVNNGGFVIWGVGGFSVMAIGTTKKSVMPKVAGITVSTAQYATYYNETEAYVMPEGLEGITVEGVNNGVLNLETRYAAGSVVPAGEALILHGAAGPYTLYAGTTTNSKIAANILKGTSTATDWTDGGAPYYRLSQHGGQVGFYYGAADGAAFQPGANKAYLALNATNAPIRFIIEGTEVATGIENLNGETIDGEPKKVMINGQVFILRGEKLYDTVGRQVK